MEPNHLNPLPPDDAALETWLRTNTALPPLPDDGFSHRVLGALPAPARHSRVSPRLLAIFVGAAAGTGLAAFKFFTGAPVDFSLPPDATDAVAQLADPKLNVALGVTVVTLVFVFWRGVQRRVGL